MINVRLARLEFVLFQNHSWCPPHGDNANIDHSWWWRRPTGSRFSFCHQIFELWTREGNLLSAKSMGQWALFISFELLKLWVMTQNERNCPFYASFLTCDFNSRVLKITIGPIKGDWHHNDTSRIPSSTTQLCFLRFSSRRIRWSPVENRCALHDWKLKSIAQTLFMNN